MDQIRLAALHERVGFEHIAVCHDAGHKVFLNSSSRSSTRQSNTTPGPHDGQYELAKQQEAEKTKVGS